MNNIHTNFNIFLNYEICEYTSLLNKLYNDKIFYHNSYKNLKHFIKKKRYNDDPDYYDKLVSLRNILEDSHFDIENKITNILKLLENYEKMKKNFI